MAFLKGRSIRATRRYMKRTARISARERIGLSRVQQRAAVRTARIRGRATRRTARATRRVERRTAGYRARSLHRAASPSGRKFRIREGKKQRWSKKYGGWENVPSRRRRRAPEENGISELVEQLKPLIQLIPILAARS